MGMTPANSHPWIWNVDQFSFRKWKKVKVKSLSRVQLFATPWTVACQAPLSMGFSRQEYWSGLPFPFQRYISKRFHKVLGSRALWGTPWRFPGHQGYFGIERVSFLFLKTILRYNCFKVQTNKIKSSVPLGTFQGLSSHMVIRVGSAV